MKRDKTKEAEISMLKSSIEELKDQIEEMERDRRAEKADQIMSQQAFCRNCKHGIPAEYQEIRAPEYRYRTYQTYKCELKAECEQYKRTNKS